MPLPLLPIQSVGQKFLCFDTKFMASVSNRINALTTITIDAEACGLMGELTMTDTRATLTLWPMNEDDADVDGANPGGSASVAPGGNDDGGTGGGGGGDSETVTWESLERPPWTNTIEGDVNDLKTWRTGTVDPKLTDFETRIAALESKVQALEDKLEGYEGVDYELCEPGETKTFLVK